MGESRLQRYCDVWFALVGLLLLWPLMLFIGLLGWFDTGAPLLLQQRVGRDERLFTLMKFRTMRVGTPHVATHLAAASSVTRLGAVLRRLKLDELPQLWNVLRGDMSLVGPRPCLPNQQTLIDERRRHGLYAVRPGITGLAQIRGVDMSDPVLLVQHEREMSTSFTMRHYFRYLLLTALGQGGGDRVIRSDVDERH